MSGNEEKEENNDANKGASKLQAFWNLFNANQGVGILTMPFVFNYGTYYAVFYIIIIGFMSNFTSKKLVRCLYDIDTQTGERVRIRESYEEVGGAAGGFPMKVAVYVTLAIEQTAYCTALLILCGTILHCSFPHLPLQVTHWSMLAFILVIPNALMKNICEVSFISLMTVLIGQVVYITVSVYSFYHARTWSIDEPTHVEVSKVFISIGVTVFSFSSQPYMPAIEKEMKQKEKFELVANLAYCAVTIIKIAFGMVGYLTFKDKTEQIITNNLPHGPLRIVTNMLILALSLASFSYPAYTVFILIDKIQVKKAQRWLEEKHEELCLNPIKVEQADETGDDEKLGKHESLSKEDLSEIKEKQSRESERNSRIRKAVIRLTILSAALTVAVIVPHFGLFMGFIGNFTAMSLAYIFPCVFHLKLQLSRLGYFQRFLHVAVIACTVITSCAGVYFSMKELIYAFQLDFICHCKH